MSGYIKNLALDSGIAEDEVNGRLAELEILQKTNPVKSHDHDGYGMNLRSPEQAYTDQVFICKDRRELNLLCDQIANDDTTAYGIPSNGVLEYLTSIFNHEPIKQLLQTTASKTLTTDWQQGVWGTTDIYIPTTQVMGQAQFYDDQSGQGDVSVNFNWVQRQVAIFQRTIGYGDLTTARFGAGKVDYVGSLRNSLTSTMALDINKINFRGVAGMRIFGLLNDPSLRAVLDSPASAANPSSSLWFYKTYDEIIADIRAMYDDIVSIAGGQADYTMPAYLGLPPAVYTNITKQNSLGTQTVAGYLKIVFPGLEIVQVQDYQGTGSPIGSDVENVCQLIFKELGGTPVAHNIFSSLYNSHGVVRLLSSYAEKVSYAISGAFYTNTNGVSTMSGI